jgi:hypothetical protein
MTDNINEITPAAAFEDEKTITLRKPVDLGGITYDHLDLREPTAKELADASKAGNDVEQAISLISRIAQVPRGAIEKLRQRDLKEASDFFARFNDDSPKTGETSLLN